MLYALYNLVLYYQLFFNSNYGSGFLWWFYLIVITSMHIIVLTIYLFSKK